MPSFRSAGSLSFYTPGWGYKRWLAIGASPRFRQSRRQTRAYSTFFAISPARSVPLPANGLSKTTRRIRCLSNGATANFKQKTRLVQAGVEFYFFFGIGPLSRIQSSKFWMVNQPMWLFSWSNGFKKTSSDFFVLLIHRGFKQ